LREETCVNTHTHTHTHTLSLSLSLRVLPARGAQGRDPGLEDLLVERKRVFPGDGEEDGGQDQAAVDQQADHDGHRATTSSFPMAAIFPAMREAMPTGEYLGGEESEHISTPGSDYRSRTRC